MKKPNNSKQITEEWPKPGRVLMGRQPRNTRLMTVRVGEESLLVQVRDNRFYRANEKLMVDRVGDGTYVDAKPKTNALLRGGQE